MRLGGEGLRDFEYPGGKKTGEAMTKPCVGNLCAGGSSQKGRIRPYPETNYRARVERHRGAQGTVKAKASSILGNGCRTRGKEYSAKKEKVTS